MRPDTWLPTCTVTSAESVPVAVTFATTLPRSTSAVSSIDGAGPPACQRQAASPTRPQAASIAATAFPRFVMSGRWDRTVRGRWPGRAGLLRRGRLRDGRGLRREGHRHGRAEPRGAGGREGPPVRFHDAAGEAEAEAHAACGP